MGSDDVCRKFDLDDVCRKFDLDDLPRRKDFDDFARRKDLDDLPKKWEFDELNYNIQNYVPYLESFAQRADIEKLPQQEDARILSESLVKVDDSVYSVKNDVTNLQNYLYQVHGQWPKNFTNLRIARTTDLEGFVQKDEMANIMNFLVEKINKAFGDFEDFNKIKADFNLVFDL